MGCDVVGDAILYLHVGGIWARRGYPGRLMSHSTNAVVACSMLILFSDLFLTQLLS